MEYSGVKRAIDVVVSACALVLLAPAFLVVALWIKLDSKGPVLFRQKRTGMNGEPFTMLKFRSMTSCNNVRDLSKKDTLTKAGKFLRITSLDEVPQLINVLRGDMSLIGPRPWIPEYYDHMNDTQRRRNDVRPGVTGLAQATGRNGLTINEKIGYDLEYVENMSLTNDIKVVLMTIKTLFDSSDETHAIGKHGIHEELHVLRQQNTMSLEEGDA